MRTTPWEPITADTNFQGLGGGCFADEKSFQWQRTLEFDVSFRTTIRIHDAAVNVLLLCSCSKQCLAYLCM
jgi:hypothetical protein